MLENHKQLSLVTLRGSEIRKIIPKIGLVQVLAFCFVCLFGLGSLIFLILDLMLYHKIYRDHNSYKCVEGQKVASLMQAEYRESGK